MRIALECAEQLDPLFQAILQGKKAEVLEYQVQIDRLEGEADEIFKEVRKHLPRTFMLPVDRRDLLGLLDMQDKIANVTQDIAGLLIERQMGIPEGIKEPLMPYVTECIGVVRHAASIMEEMDELLETGFAGPQALRVSGMIDELNEIEHQSDLTGIAVSKALFAHEDEINPVSVIFWYKLLEWIGDTADYAEAVGNRLRLMIAAR